MSTDARPQRLGEEIANSITHGIGALLAAAGTAVLVVYAASGGAMRVVAASVFGGTLVLLYLASTLYHALAPNRAKAVFQVLDHATIYILIAGTYTPFSLLALRGAWGWSLFSIIWALAVTGVTLEATLHRRFHSISLVIYVAMGWLGTVAAIPFVRAVETPVTVCVVAGGLAYTLGIVFYAWKRLPYGHMVWHLFVLTGSILHFWGVLLVIRG